MMRISFNLVDDENSASILNCACMFFVFPCFSVEKIKSMEIFIHWQKPKNASTRNITVTIHLNDAIETPHIVLWRHLLRMYSHLKFCYRKLLGNFLVHFSNSIGVFSFCIRSLTVSLSFSPVYPRDIWIHYFLYSRSLFSHTVCSQCRFCYGQTSIARQCKKKKSKCFGVCNAIM